MKVVFYGIKLKVGKRNGATRWQWNVTLDLSIDVQHWARQKVIDGMVVLHPKISLGQAFMLREQLSGLMKELSINECEAMLRKTLQHIKLDEKIIDQLRLEEVDLVESERLLDRQVLTQLKEQLEGRALLQEELMDLLQHLRLEHIDWRSYVQKLYLLGHVLLLNGVSRGNKDYICQRCGSGGDQLFWSDCQSCHSECPYCEACLNMGRTRYCSLLIHGQDRKVAGVFYDDPQLSPQWREKSLTYLSEAQREAAVAGLEFLERTSKQSVAYLGGKSKQSVARLDRGRREVGAFLLWAVTGAGKTEMTFPLIESEFERRGRVALTTPRRDVVLELEPRLQKAFPDHALVTLYGGSKQRWEQGDLTLATTHQLLRFQSAFDLIIIDEVDAYPFRFNAMLEFAVQKSCTPNGRYILLSATPPSHLQKAVKKGKLPHAKVCVRFHRYPLPVPKILKMNDRILLQEIEQSLAMDKQLFIFVPKIKLIPALVRSLRERLPQVAIEGTSSQDPERADKVIQFRQGVFRVLVTTTILERGVTVPKTDVLILHADDDIFDESALVQMAGRSGRASSDPIGKVRFLAKDKTMSQVKAIKQIKMMNHLARRKGYLIHRDGEQGAHVSV